MKNKSFKAIFGLVIIIFVMGCANLGRPDKDIGIDDIAGSWENINIGYIYLYIDKTGTGYLIPGLNELDDIYEINSISFSGFSAIITFIANDNNKDRIKAECTPFGKNLFGFKPIDENEQEDALIFMRESKVQEFRHKAKEFIKNKGFVAHNPGFQWDR